MKKQYLTPQMTAYAVPCMALLSGSNFDWEDPETTGEDFVNPGGGNVDPGNAL